VQPKRGLRYDGSHDGPGRLPDSEARVQGRDPLPDGRGPQARPRRAARVPLATWEYRAPLADGKRHFGFVIDDVGSSPSVEPNGSVVDLYGYTSMAVAAFQEQAAQIDELKREVAQLRKDLEASAASR
jgi:hypothetical protein